MNHHRTISSLAVAFVLLVAACQPEAPPLEQTQTLSQVEGEYEVARTQPADLPR